jgi:hypothetical protein
VRLRCSAGRSIVIGTSNLPRSVKNVQKIIFTSVIDDLAQREIVEN